MAKDSGRTDSEEEKAIDVVNTPEIDESDELLDPKEKIRRKRAVAASKRLFRFFDISLDYAQNACPYVNRNNRDTIKRTDDIVYDNMLPGVCKMDMYRVSSPGFQPALILIHGGGFSAGGKEYRRGHAQYYALNGFTVFCLDYGLAPKFSFPEPVRHIVNAANFIYDHAREYGIDPNRIMVGGDSAGAYYSAMLGVLNCGDAYKNKFGFELKFKVFGALLVCGLYDLKTVLNTKYLLDLDDGVFLGFTGISRNDINEYEYRDYCLPLGFINEKFPPAFVVHSGYDLFCQDQGKVLLEKLEKEGVYCESYMARHATSNHDFSLNWRGEDASCANELMMSFAKRLANDKIKL